MSRWSVNPALRLALSGVKTFASAKTSPSLALRARHCSTKKPAPDSDESTMTVRVAPIVRTNEALDTKRARLVYQSRKRGILEADLLLSGFAAKYLKEMTPEELDEYDKLLDELDWDIYYWATKNYDVTPLPEKWQNSSVLKRLQEYSQNKEKVILRMPDISEF